MEKRKIVDNVYKLGAVDWDRRLFDSLIPLPDGTSYNSYLVNGSEKTALVDTSEQEMSRIFMEQLIDVPSIDYLIANHAEQDHSGLIPFVLEKYPEAKVVCTPKCKDMLVDHLHLDAGRIITVNDGDSLSLGDKNFKFIHTPWVHWPETMCSYLEEHAILFSCDFFGSHLATSYLYVHDEGLVYEAAKRYYAEIMMPFRIPIRKNIDKILGYKVKIIAPSHGPMYDKPEFIIDAYKDWASDKPKNNVVIPYTSMHGSTRDLVERLVNALAIRNVNVQQFDMAVTDIGKVAISLVDAATVVLGTPAVHVGPHPVVAYAAYLANALRPKVKFASVIGSYGWGGKVVEQIAALIPNLKVEIIDPVMVKGKPREADLAAIESLAEKIVMKHDVLLKT